MKIKQLGDFKGGGREVFPGSSDDGRSRAPGLGGGRVRGGLLVAFMENLGRSGLTSPAHLWKPSDFGVEVYLTTYHCAP